MYRPVTCEDVQAAQAHLVLLKSKMRYRRTLGRQAPSACADLSQDFSPGLRQTAVVGGAKRGGTSSVPLSPPAGGPFRHKAAQRNSDSGHRGAAYPSSGSGLPANLSARAPVPVTPSLSVPRHSASSQPGASGFGVAVASSVGLRGSLTGTTTSPANVIAAPIGAQDKAATAPLVPCPDCGRSFNPESIDKHLKICKKVFQQKRKKFNSAANRLGDLENAGELIKNANRLEKEREKPYTKVDEVPEWKKKSLAFRAAILQAKAQSGDHTAAAKAADIQQTLDAAGGADSSLTPCPHCGRTFNKEAGERHIAICQKTFGSKPGGGRLIKGGGRVAASSSGHTRPPSTVPSAAPEHPSAAARSGVLPSGGGNAASRRPSSQRGRAAGNSVGGGAYNYQSASSRAVPGNARGYPYR